MRVSRTRSSSLFDFDLDEIQRIALQAGATKKQMEMAYSRALARTAVTLKKQAMALMKDGIAPKSQNQLRRRLMSVRNSTKGTAVDEFKLWFGLNRIKVKDLRGRIKGKVLPRHNVRDGRGRFTAAPVRQAPSFQPRGSMLRPATWSDGAVTLDRKGQKTIVRGREDVEIDIYDALVTRIEDDIFPNAVEIFMKNFRHEVAFRAKSGR